MSNACSLVHGRTQAVSVTTNVPAKIRIDGQFYGETKEGEPVIAELSRSRSHFVMATADGHHGETLRVQTTLSTLGVLDTVGGFLILIPWITLFTGHAWGLAPDQVHLSLEES